MKVIVEKDLSNIWDKFYEKFKFNPSVGVDEIPFQFDINYKVYKLKSVWTERQEKIVNNILKKVSNSNIYALDWQHDCFEFNPQEEIPLYYRYHDNDRNCEVYFPSYYPNGDYYFFLSKDLSYGLLGHPWRQEIYVFGESLIGGFEKQIGELDIC